MPDVTTAEENFRSRLEEAERLRRAGRLADAEHCYLDLLIGRPEASKAICGLGEVRFDMGDIPAAAEHFTRALALNPELSRALLGLARIAEKSGDLEKSLDCFRRAQSIAPEIPWLADRILVVEQNLSELRRKAELRDPKTVFWERFNFANELIARKNLNEAEAIFRDLLAADPNNAVVLCKLGRIAGDLGRTGEAMAHLDQAIAADPTYPYSYMRQSEILEASGDRDAAIRVLEAALLRDPTMSGPGERIASLRKRQQQDRERQAGVRIRKYASASHSSDALTHGKSRPRVTVIAWDLTHNPVGRAMILADLAAPNAATEIVGPLFTVRGTDLWPPLREGRHNADIRGFEADSFATFMEGAVRLVMEKPCDVAWVSKARLPGLIIGFLYKLIHGSSILLDIDDDEVAIVRGEQPLTLDEFLAESGPSDWKDPYSKRWTQLAASLIDHADAITVCNPALQDRFGGIVLRHARDPRPFEEARARRHHIRAEFGFGDREKVILFLGTPRRHKGVLDVARALPRLNDPDVVFCVIGTMLDKTLQRDLEAIPSARIVFFPDQPYSRLAELNAMADVVCILQDPADPIAAAQTPAKLTDALASGTLVLATSVPSLTDVLAAGQITEVSDETLVDELRMALASGCRDAGAGEARRTYFRTEFATDVNAKRAYTAIKLAQQRNGPIPDEILSLFRYIDQFMPGSLPQECVAASKGAFRGGARVGALRTLEDGVNLVFFWKQNDSSIFGRRQDMLLKQFAAMPNIRKILHIDAPMSVDQLHALSSSGAATATSLGRHIAANTIGRVLTTADDDRIHRRAFVYRGKETHLFGRELPGIDSFPNAVEAWLRELDMTENVLAWVCPVVPYFPEVQKRLGFSFVASDVIDDQRQWPMHPEWRARLEKNYLETFARTSAAFANCEPVAEWLRREGLDPVVVPNGIDIRADVDRWDVPLALRNLPRPIVGYCGNLSHRFDWDLIDGISAARPHWSFVLIGEPPKEDRYVQMGARKNVHALGMVPYESALRHIAAFDAAMIPHTRSGLSEHMNPLKLYVYRGLGVRVVSTAVANLQDFTGEVRIANSVDHFVADLEAAIDEKRDLGRHFPAADRMQIYSWEGRASQIFAHLENVLQSAGQNSREGVAA